jgi:hypothetical protein
MSDGSSTLSLPPSLHLQPVRVATGCADAEGVLVLRNGELAAVLVRLADEAHGDDVGRWFIEAAFGPQRPSTAPLFDAPEQAAAWITQQSPRPPRLAVIEGGPADAG